MPLYTLYPSLSKQFSSLQDCNYTSKICIFKQKVVPEHLQTSTDIMTCAIRQHNALLMYY